MTPKGEDKKVGVRNRCLIFDDTDGKIGIDEYEEQKRVSATDALALSPGPGARV
jgi:hypothetical protein